MCFAALGAFFGPDGNAATEDQCFQETAGAHVDIPASWTPLAADSADMGKSSEFPWHMGVTGQRSVLTRFPQCAKYRPPRRFVRWRRQ
ncbi:MAG: hypothetical protein B7Z55_00260 [Planctomycetales bacterium 12-60-4]|nr:MAG: hypothetical protein B7Z55_00260 [Planctomycetales bacterium 12-60-4]